MSLFTDRDKQQYVYISILNAISEYMYIKHAACDRRQSKHFMLCMKVVTAATRNFTKN